MKVYNTKEWFKFIFKIHKSDTLQRLWPTIILMGFISWGVAYIEIDYLELGQNSSLKNMSLLHGVIGFVLSLLLVFRTNTAYDRWWEGRKLWGKLMNDSRNFALMIDALLDKKDENRVFFSAQLKMFPKLLHTHLTNESTKFTLDQSEHPEFEDLAKQSHPPSMVVLRMRRKINELVKNGTIQPEDKIVLEHSLSGFMDVVGGCERIKNTPIPFAYALFIKKFIFIYVITLPIGYVFTAGYFVVPLVMITFYVLLSLELIAEEIEDPFNGGEDDLPTLKIAENIAKSVKRILIDSTKK